MQRPDFSEIKTYEEFSKYYWYREELQKICNQLGIDASGMKAELNHNIEEYFKGNLIQKTTKKTSASKKSEDIPLTLETSLIECNFRFSQRMRDFFSEQTGIKNFKFNTDMVATAKKSAKQMTQRLPLVTSWIFTTAAKPTLLMINHACNGISLFRIFVQTQQQKSFQINSRPPPAFGKQSASQHVKKFINMSYWSY